MADVHGPPTANGIEETSERSEQLQTSPAAQFRERDEVFWTELEIRRLGNLVAECIHARRYAGDSSKAGAERKQMRTYIDAMKRKSMRVLHRAELYAKSGHAAWPGIDPTITDPVSLAEEYVRVVENYETVLTEEESSIKAAKDEERSRGDASAPIITEEEDTAISPEQDDWVAADEKAFKEALEREKELLKSSNNSRKELLGESDEGVRRRKGGAGPSDQTAELSKDDEEFMARQNSTQNELTANLVDLVGQLKKSASENKGKLERDDKVIDETEEAVDRNLSGVGKQRTELKKFDQSSSTSWWIMIIAAIMVVLVFVLVFVLLRIPV